MPNACEGLKMNACEGLTIKKIIKATHGFFREANSIMMKEERKTNRGETKNFHAIRFSEIPLREIYIIQWAENDGLRNMFCRKPRQSFVRAASIQSANVLGG